MSAGTGTVELKPCPPKRGDKLVWARMLEHRPLAVCDLDTVTVASFGDFGPLSVTLQEVAGIFPLGWFDRPQPTPAGEIVERLCALHEKMLNAVKRQRPYPVSIALGDSDLDTVLDAAVAFEQQAATIAERDARIEALKGALKVSADAIDETLDKDFGFWSSAARGARRAVMWGARVIARATLER